jgi:hypothetical protein
VEEYVPESSGGFGIRTRNAVDGGNATWLPMETDGSVPLDPSGWQPLR